MDQASGAGKSTYFPSRTKKISKLFKRLRFIPFFLVVVMFLLGIIYLVSHHHTAQQSQVSATTASTNTQVQIAPPLAQEQVNKSFTFPLRDTTGKEVSKIQYVLQSAEIDNQIILKGQKATAVAGKEFLIINLQITNNYTKSIDLNTRDYVRLSVNNSSERLAPDIYNDPVEVQAISTKLTRLGFAINTSDRNLVLHVGEITGPKQDVKLTLQ